MSYPVRAFSCDNLGSKELAVSAAVGADNLPAGIVVPPGVYNVFGVRVDMTAEKLYRISDFNTRSVQVISYASDFDQLVTSISWLGQIGYDDIVWSPAMLAAARIRSINTTCGGYSRLAEAIFSQLGIPSRTVGGAAFAGFNGYDDGHTILEVQRDGQWVAFDFLLKYRFFATDGTPLSLLGLHDALRLNLPVDFFVIGPRSVPSDTSKYVWLQDAVRHHIRDWYKRIFEMVYVPSGNSFYMKYETAAEQSSIPPRGSIPVDRATYISTFYGPLAPPSNTYVGQQPNTTTPWGPGTYTVADMNLQLHAGSTVEKIGVYLNEPATVQIKILQQITPGSFAMMQSYPFSHPGGGWADFTIPGGYVVPSTAAICRPGFSANLPSVAFSTLGSRSFAAGDLPVGQLASFYNATNGSVCMRWTKAAP